MNVKLYSTPTCPYCKLIREFFWSRGIEFEEIDVTEFPMLDAQMRLVGQIGTPVVDIDGKIIVGWNKPALEEFFKSSSQDGRKG